MDSEESSNFSYSGGSSRFLADYDQDETRASSIQSRRRELRGRDEDRIVDPTRRAGELDCSLDPTHRAGELDCSFGPTRRAGELDCLFGLPRHWGDGRILIFGFCSISFLIRETFSTFVVRFSKVVKSF
ncbi:hypothetical protein IGI04_015044 [Brassica rapa subsp. trilocularis]|uniref:Uncharacterized protein n=1 Tax=Brassica rapa subsp. trilocularis TaxID=1813537 RepID=A0ABQ7MP21_BRACM|nr:hypothetical protein IGI04_015044 [Brassica rapa subsp. trilocularis]